MNLMTSLIVFAADEKSKIGNELVNGWTTFWGAIDKSGSISTLLSIAGGAVMAWFLLSWLWKKSRGGGGGGSPMQGFPYWPMAVGLLLTAPTFLIPLVLRLLQGLINVLSGILGYITNTLSGN